MRRAVEALRSSHGWRVLRDMDRAGDWPEVFWEYADEIAAGTVRAGYVQAPGLPVTGDGDAPGEATPGAPPSVGQSSRWSCHHCWPSAGRVSIGS